MAVLKKQEAIIPGKASSRSRSIKSRITILVLGLLIIVFSLSWTYSYWSLYRKTLEDQRREAQTIARLISGIASYTFLTEDYTMLDEILQKASENDNVLFIRILDRDKRPKRDQMKDRTDKRFIEEKVQIIVADSPAGEVVLGFSIEKTLAGLMKEIRTTLVLVVVGLALSSAFLIFLLNRLIIKPIFVLDKRAKEIAVGDLTSTIEIRGDDEIASLGNSINAMAASLKDMIFRLRQTAKTVSGVTDTVAASSERVVHGAAVQKAAIRETAVAMEEMNSSVADIASNADSLTTLSRNTASSIIQMESAIAKIAHSSGVFNESAAETASSIEEMIASIRQIADNLNMLSSSSEDTSSAVSEMSASVKEVEQSAKDSVKLSEDVDRFASDKAMTSLSAAIRGMSDIKENVSALSGIINRLGKKSKDIGNILTVIDDVTEQTNLLAINAAILAAKAGNHGKGFSIVADEIKNLAERTSFSTSEVAKLIADVQEETRASVEMTARGIDTVEKGAALVKDVSDALGSIISSSQVSTEMSKTIQKATQEEVVVISQITKAVKVIAEQISQISLATEEQSRGSRFIIEAAEKMKSESSQVKDSTLVQTKESRLITTSIESVARQTAQIADATNSQRLRGTAIVKAVEMIQETTDELLQSSAEMDKTISALKDEANNLLMEIQKFKV